MAVITFAISASTVFIALQVSWSSIYDILFHFFGAESYALLIKTFLLLLLIHSLLLASSYTSWLELLASLHTISCLSSANSCRGSAWLTLCSAPKSIVSLRSEVGVWLHLLSSFTCSEKQQVEMFVELHKVKHYELPCYERVRSPTWSAPEKNTVHEHLLESFIGPIQQYIIIFKQ